MAESARRHDVSDAVWALLGPHLPGQSGQWGGIAKDNRQCQEPLFIHRHCPDSLSRTMTHNLMTILSKGVSS